MRRIFCCLFSLILLVTFLPAAAQDATADAPEAGDVRVDAAGIEQMYVPAGCFLMGTSDDEAEYARSLGAPDWAARRVASEQAQHEVCLSEGYWIDRYEVSNAAFGAFVEAGGYSDAAYWSEEGWSWLSRQRRPELLPVDCANDQTPDHPRVCVTWFEAEAYAHWRGASLPSEAQWEYAARGPESSIYPWGDEWDAALANVIDSEGLAAVDAYPDGVSWVGAFNMAGNAMEWVQDWLSDGYDADPVTDPTGLVEGEIKVEKGGWWGSNPLVARAAYRHFEDPPSYRDHHIGFRLVSSASSSATVDLQESGAPPIQ